MQEKLRKVLKANTNEEKLILDHLCVGIDEMLLAQIIESKKTLQGCWSYIVSRAKEYLNSKSGAVKDEIVFGWAVHYFQENDIKENESPKAVVDSKPTTIPAGDKKRVEKPKTSVKTNVKKKQVKKIDKKEIKKNVEDEFTEGLFAFL